MYYHQSSPPSLFWPPFDPLVLHYIVMLLYGLDVTVGCMRHQLSQRAIEYLVYSDEYIHSYIETIASAVTCQLSYLIIFQEDTKTISQYNNYYIISILFFCKIKYKFFFLIKEYNFR